MFLLPRVASSSPRRRLRTPPLPLPPACLPSPHPPPPPPKGAQDSSAQCARARARPRLFGIRGGHALGALPPALRKRGAGVAYPPPPPIPNQINFTASPSLLATLGCISSPPPPFFFFSQRLSAVLSQQQAAIAQLVTVLNTNARDLAIMQAALPQRTISAGTAEMRY
ncbi:hypothetical protein T492DRAFT_541233 [Pavlovales sp. CCMP2436]|nr:hypothetical protein T492DRAFT_541233 [Pavlovales sp. CCMP2436]